MMGKLETVEWMKNKVKFGRSVEQYEWKWLGLNELWGIEKGIGNFISHYRINIKL